MTQYIPTCEKCQKERGEGRGTYKSKSVKIGGRPTLICKECKEAEEANEYKLWNAKSVEKN